VVFRRCCADARRARDRSGPVIGLCFTAKQQIDRGAIHHLTLRTRRQRRMNGENTLQQPHTHIPLTLSVKNVTSSTPRFSSAQIFSYAALCSFDPAVVGSKCAANKGLISRVVSPSPFSTAEKNWSCACTLPEEKMARVLPACFQVSRVGITSSKSGVLSSPSS
jgi:hypothetical protein